MWRDDGDYDGDGGDGSVAGNGDGFLLGTLDHIEIGCSTEMLIIKIVSVMIFETSGEVQNAC